MPELSLQGKPPLQEATTLLIPTTHRGYHNTLLIQEINPQ